MTTVTLRIQVDKAGATQGIQQTRQELAGLGQAGQQAGQQASQGVGAISSALNGARAAVASFLAVYAGIQTLSGVVRLADEYQSLSDRLRLATDGSAAFQAAQAGVFAVAQQTGTALSAVGGLYVSLSNSTRELGLSQNELLTITQAISQSFVVSGASAASTDAAVRQLAQGFASGVLRGDEFNSVMENAPALARALAESLGVTTGELRAMAAEGKLTSDVLAQGLLQQAPQIAAQFDQMGTTVGQAFTRLGNAVLQFVGQANEASGAGAALAAIITGLANNLPLFANGLLAVAAGYAAVTAAAAVANPAIGFTGTLLAGLATAISVVVAAFAAYKLGEYLRDQFELARVAGASLVIGLNDAWQAIRTGAIAAFVAIRVAWVTVVDQIQERVADLLDAFISLSQVELPFGLRADFAYGQADALRQLTETLRSATDATEENDRAIGLLRDEMDRAAADSDAFAADLFDAAEAHNGAAGAADRNRGAVSALAPAMTATASATNAAATAARAARAAFDGATAGASGLSGATTAAGGSINTMRGAIAGTTGDVGRLGSAVDDLGQRAQEFGIDWGLVIDDASRAFGDWVASGLKSFSDFGRSLKQIAKQIISDLAAQFFRSRLTIPITAALGGSGAAGAATPGGGLLGGAGGAGGAGGLLGGLLGGAGALFGGTATGLGTGLLASGSIFSGAGLLGGITGSLSAGFASIAGGSILQGVGLLLGPVGIIAGSIAALVSIFKKDKPPDVRFGGDNARVRNVEGQFSTVFGTVQAGSRQISYQDFIEPIQQFDEGIRSLVLATGGGADQLTAIGQALSRWVVDLRGDAATAENVLGSRFSAVLTAFSADVQEFVGSSGTLEERVARLGDALTISSIAASGIVSGDFREVADLLTRFRAGTEGLGDTFARLVAGADLINQTLALLGGTFAGTRLQAATFAGELIQLAGGLDQFSATLSGALNALFTDAERNQFLADQARAALNESLRGLNISGVGIDSIRTQLRDQLRAALEAGNAELTNQILAAANQLGAFSSALEALGADAMAAAQQVALGGTSLQPGSGLTAPAGTAAGGTATVPATQLEAGQATVRAIARSNTLLEEIASNTSPSTEEQRAAKSTQNTEGLTRRAVDLLAEVAALLRAQGVQQTQIALKATVRK